MCCDQIWTGVCVGQLVLALNETDLMQGFQLIWLLPYMRRYLLAYVNKYSTSLMSTYCRVCLAFRLSIILMLWLQIRIQCLRIHPSFTLSRVMPLVFLSDLTHVIMRSESTCRLAWPSELSVLQYPFARPLRYLGGDQPPIYTASPTLFGICIRGRLSSQSQPMRRAPMLHEPQTKMLN